MSDDPLDKLAKKVREHKPVRKVTRTNRTLALAEPNFTTLQKYCRAKGLTMSEVVDGLIEAFLGKVSDDLPVDTKIKSDE